MPQRRGGLALGVTRADLVELALGHARQHGWINGEARCALVGEPDEAKVALDGVICAQDRAGDAPERGTALLVTDCLAATLDRRKFRDQCTTGRTRDALADGDIRLQMRVTRPIEKPVWVEVHDVEKLITRKEHPDDKRTMVVRLTDPGRTVFLKMAKRHEEWVISLLGDLSGGAQSDLLHSLVLLKKRLGDGTVRNSERPRMPARR